MALKVLLKLKLRAFNCCVERVESMHRCLRKLQEPESHWNENQILGCFDPVKLLENICCLLGGAKEYLGAGLVEKRVEWGSVNACVCYMVMVPLHRLYQSHFTPSDMHQSAFFPCMWGVTVTSNMHSSEPSDNTVIVSDVASISKVGTYLNSRLNETKLLISKQFSSTYFHCNNAEKQSCTNGKLSYFGMKLCPSLHWTLRVECSLPF